MTTSHSDARAEIDAMAAVLDALGPLSQRDRARTLATAAMLSCPQAFTDEQWLRLIHAAQAEATP
jgi:hypothetical protein